MRARIAAGIGAATQSPARHPVDSIAILGFEQSFDLHCRRAQILSRRDDPLFLACEGRVVAVVDAAQADEALARWRAPPSARDAAIIGSINTGRAHVVLETELGGERVLEELEDDPLPRIC